MGRVSSLTWVTCGSYGQWLLRVRKLYRGFKARHADTCLMICRIVVVMLMGYFSDSLEVYMRVNH
jgi:hypothetical protein